MTKVKTCQDKSTKVKLVRARSTHLFLPINNMSRIFKQGYYRVESTLRSGLAQKVSYISEQ